MGNDEQSPADNASEAPINIDPAALKKKRISISVGGAIALVVILIGGHEYVADHTQSKFISTVRADEIAQVAQTALEQSTQANNNLLAYIKRAEIKEVSEKIEQYKDQIQETELWEAANGENPISKARKKDLGSRLEIATEQRDCLRDSSKTLDACDV